MITWTKAPDFKPSEFSENPDKFADPRLIYNLQDYRNLLGKKVYPSPVPGALARSDKVSQHYYNLEADIKSRAGDVFVEGCTAEAWQIAVTSQLWGGVGLYLNTLFKNQKWLMLHLDLRALGKNHSKKTVLLWIRDKKGQYRYPQYEKGGMKYLFKTLKKISRE